MAAGQCNEQLLHPERSADGLKRQAEDGRADEYEDHKSPTASGSCPSPAQGLIDGVRARSPWRAHRRHRLRRLPSGSPHPGRSFPEPGRSRPRGGIRTNVTRSAIRDSSPSRSSRLSPDSAKATPTPMHIDTTISSSVGRPAPRDCANATAQPAETRNRPSSDGRPADPSSSRIVRASFGNAGTHAGFSTLIAVHRRRTARSAQSPG